MIPEGAVEAAAIAAHNFANHRQWDDVSEQTHKDARKIARKALEAAAPHMLPAIGSEA